MSCADVQTIQAGNGSKTQFSFDFPYIFKSEIQVSFWNATTKEWDVIAQTDATYPWQVTDANPTIVEFTGTAPPAPAVPVDPNETAVDNVKIRRVTNIDDIRALFNPGSAIRSDDLNKNFEQLRYAIQEANCQGVPDDIYQYLLDNYWDRFDNTLYSADTWRSDDATIATTAALDQRFQDEVTDTFTKAELAAASNLMPDNDDAVPTTGAVNDYINEVITNDIGTDGTGITVTDDGDGTITLGLADNSIDFSKIKNEDIITYAEQNAGTPSWDSDNRLATTYASARRFDTLVQQAIPSGSDWQVGKTWLQNDQDLTLSIWNGINWLAIASGGAFINQPKVVYVDASSGADTNDGHRISRPKRTIKAAINQINSDSTYGDGSVVVVAPGVYQEVAPIDILKKDVGIIGTALRSCVIHPTPATETNSLFRVNSGTFLQNLTFTGVKASGSRGGAGSVDPDNTYGVPVTQGWNVSFYPNATIVKSPYIQNCTNFSDSEINNSSLDPHNPAGGSGGDTDSAVTGGGLLVDGSVVNSSSPLRSMVCDSYTHVGLDGPGILVTNNGYAQCTSSYAFFNHYHIKCLNGGQANLAASTTDFGRYGLIADGRSPSAIFTATTTVAADDGDISFTIGAPVAQAGWHGSATRPQSNMLVDIGGNTYPILSANANGAGWDVTISRPDPADRAVNLGLDGAVANGSAVSFYLRSMIASSGHTMEYVGSGTNYSALPENGGVPIEANQVVELNDGKVWTATTDHNGKFKVGDFFTVDQQNSSISVASGSFQVNLGTLAVDGSGNAIIGAPLDLNGNALLDSTGSVTISDTLDVNGNKIVNVTDPTLAQDAATKNYVDSTFVELQGDTMTGALALPSGTAAAPALSVGTTDNGIYSPGADQLAISTNGTGRLFIDSSGRVGIGTTPSARALEVSSSLQIVSAFKSTSTASRVAFVDSTSTDDSRSGIGSVGDGTAIYAGSFERLRVDASGRVLVGTSTARGIASSTSALIQVEAGSSLQFAATANRADGVGPFFCFGKSRGTSSGSNDIVNSGDQLGTIRFAGADGTDIQSIGAAISAEVDGTPGANDMPGRLVLSTTADGSASPTERLRIDSSGNVTIGSTDAGLATSGQRLKVTGGTIEFDPGSGADSTRAFNFNIGASNFAKLLVPSGSGGALAIHTGGAGAVSERLRIDSSGRLLVGTSTTVGRGMSYPIQVNATTDAGLQIGRWSNNASQPFLILSKSRATTVGGTGIVSSGDVIGDVGFRADDGSGGNFIVAGNIRCEVDGTPGANDMPGRLVFSTTADGASTPTERLRIASDGKVGIGTSSPDTKLNVVQSSTGRAWAPTAGQGDLILERNGNVGLAIIGANTSTSTLNFGDTDDENAGFISYYHADDAMVFRTGGSGEDMRIDSSGRLLVGTSIARGNLYNGAVSPQVQSENVGSTAVEYLATRVSNDFFGGSFVLAKARGTTAGSTTIVQSGDQVGAISFQSSDGSEFVEAASIQAQVDGTPGANDMPGRLVFSTTADGASTPTEAMRIKNSRIINFANAPTYADNTAALAGGLVAGDVYRKSDGTLMITY
jgi:hypothetical protein